MRLALAFVLLAGCAAADPRSNRNAQEPDLKRSPVHSDAAPKAIGPYSQAITLDGLVFCSGQVALDPQSGQLVGHDVAEQTQRALQNLTAVLTAAGSSCEHVVKTTVFLVDMNDFAAMNDVYARFFTGTKPARSTVAVAALPKGARVEIDCIATR